MSFIVVYIAVYFACSRKKEKFPQIWAYLQKVYACLTRCKNGITAFTTDTEFMKNRDLLNYLIKRSPKCLKGFFYIECKLKLRCRTVLWKCRRVGEGGGSFNLEILRGEGLKQFWKFRQKRGSNNCEFRHGGVDILWNNPSHFFDKLNLCRSSHHCDHSLIGSHQCWAFCLLHHEWHHNQRDHCHSPCCIGSLPVDAYYNYDVPDSDSNENRWL